ncbi:MAG: nuclear transport factor 2 family protein [Methylovulum sp.]|nr:nuclear transport factor 2 family protein [Methylovulum sp.]
MTNAEQIISAVNTMALAMAEGRLDDVLSAYEANATLVAQPGMNAAGPALREAFQSFIAMQPKFSMPEHDVIEAGDIALHIAPWTMTATDPTTGNAIGQSGLSLAVFRRQADGEWLMVIDNPYGSVLLAK